MGVGIYSLDGSGNDKDRNSSYACRPFRELRKHNPLDLIRRTEILVYPGFLSGMGTERLLRSKATLGGLSCGLSSSWVWGSIMFYTINIIPLLTWFGYFYLQLLLWFTEQLFFLLDSYEQPRQHIKKKRHYFVNKGLVKAMVFPVGHVWMWELDYK